MNANIEISTLLFPNWLQKENGFVKRFLLQLNDHRGMITSVSLLGFVFNFDDQPFKTIISDTVQKVGWGYNVSFSEILFTISPLIL